MPVVSRYFTPNRVVYERVRVEGTEELVDDGTAEAGPVYQYLLVYPKTERSVFILALRRCA